MTRKMMELSKNEADLICKMRLESAARAEKIKENPGTIFERVRAVLVDVLTVDEGEVTPTASIIKDLGAESIDFLDMIFRLEKEFKIKISRQGFLIPIQLIEEPYVKAGKFTPAGLAELERRAPFYDLTALKTDPRIENFDYTVATIVQYVEARLQQKN